MNFESILKEVETPRSSPSSPGTSRTFSFFAPRYKDFDEDVTFGEGDSYFGTINFDYISSCQYDFNINLIFC